MPDGGRKGHGVAGGSRWRKAWGGERGGEGGREGARWRPASPERAAVVSALAARDHSGSHIGRMI